MHSLWVWIVSFFVWLSADSDLLEREAAKAAAAGAAAAAAFAVEASPAPAPAPAPAPKPSPAPTKGGAVAVDCPTGTCPKPVTPPRK
jgi:hypothetical protein